MSPLTEPEVLAEAKSFLMDQDSDTGYAVVDSQFQVERWGNTEIPDRIQRQLRPINSLQLRGGEPDALLTPPRQYTYRESEQKPFTETPLAVLEAKGATAGSRQNATRVAITQAHRHLSEVNVGYAAAPGSYITEQDQALGREVNVGLLAVTPEEVELLETPRLVGAGTSRTTDTIRFHARFGDTAVENLSKNHPKNALGYALAVQADGPIDELFQSYVIESVGDGRRDAESLGLVEVSLGQPQLTAIGMEAVRTVAFHHGGVLAALEEINELYRSTTRFIETCPVMGAVARQTLLTYPPTQILVDTIGKLMEDGMEEPVLADVAKAIARDYPDFALDLFIADKDRGKVLNEDTGKIDIDSLSEGQVYSSHTTFQYKAMLFHTGILTTLGEDTKANIRPGKDIWALETPL